MPVRYTIEPVPGLVRVELSGAVGVEDVRELVAGLARDPALRPGMPQLVDLSELSTPPTAAESEAVANAFGRYRAQFGGARWAVVVTDMFTYGVVRQFAALAIRASIEVRPFLDRGEAERWLGVAVPGRD
jgi:hypothetical protein